MVLPIDLEEEFKAFFNKTFKIDNNMGHNSLMAGRELADILFKGTHGITIETFVEKEREKEREKAAQEREVIKRHVFRGETIETIAKAMNLDIAVINTIIAAYKD